MSYKEKFNIDYKLVIMDINSTYTIEEILLLKTWVDRGITFELIAQRYTQYLERDEVQYKIQKLKQIFLHERISFIGYVNSI